VFGKLRMVVPARRRGWAGDALTLVKNLGCLFGDARFQFLDKAEGCLIPVAVDLNVVDAGRGSIRTENLAHSDR
jgi:hypothetical protein